MISTIKVSSSSPFALVGWEVDTLTVDIIGAGAGTSAGWDAAAGGGVVVVAATAGAAGATGAAAGAAGTGTGVGADTEGGEREVRSLEAIVVWPKGRQHPLPTGT